MNNKLLEWFHEGGPIPRKLKKKILGTRMKRKKLRHLLKTLKLGEPIKTMYERIDSNHGLFCPKCGETGSRSTGNMTTYPEHWEYFYCLRCGFKVGYIDNSPFYHALQFAPHYELP